MVDNQPTVQPAQEQEMPKHAPRPQPPAPSPWPQTLEPCTWPRTLVTYPHSRLNNLQPVMPQQPHPVVVGGWGSWKHLGCGCESSTGLWIGRWQQSPRCQTPRRTSSGCSSQWGVCWCCGRQGLSQSWHWRWGDGCCVRVRVGFLSCSFSLSKSIYLRQRLLHVSRGFWITQGVYYLWVLYWFHFIQSTMGHCSCSVFATLRVLGTSLWLCWYSKNLSS